MNIALAVIAVSLLIFIHEFGHFIMAKLVGMRVEIFSIGFWKTIFSFRLGETEYRLSCVPLGGYVKVTDESPEAGSGDPRGFWSKTPGQRALFIVGGVFMNFVLALVLFVIAFWIGVPFAVAEVGSTDPGGAAWEAGVQRGDVIVAVDGLEHPTFMDLTRAVALSSRQVIDLTVERGGRPVSISVKPRYEEQLGLRVIGLWTPRVPIITDFTELEGVRPAEDAGLQLGDRILLVNGVPARTAHDAERALLGTGGQDVTLVVRRGQESLTKTLAVLPAWRYVLGISAVSAEVAGVQPGGTADGIGLRKGDVVRAVNGRPVRSSVEIHDAALAAGGPATLQVDRGGQEVVLQMDMHDYQALDDFEESVLFRLPAGSDDGAEPGVVIQWVREDGPAWEAGLRPGDALVDVAGEEVSDWSDVLRANARAGRGPYEIAWLRHGERGSGSVTPVRDASDGQVEPGFRMGQQKTEFRRYGVGAAIVKGMQNTRDTIGEILMMIRGFATRQVSPKQMGGIVTIVGASYYAAEAGLGRLLYLTAVISASIAFLNMLPIPVLDGGHLLFLLIEKVRGRRVGERALAIAQTVGFALLMLLVIYVTRNDIMRIIDMY